MAQPIKPSFPDRTVIADPLLQGDCQVDTSVLFLAPTLEQPLRAGCSGSDRDPATEQPADSAVANSQQIAVEPPLHAQVPFPSAVGCGRGASHRLLADPDSVGQSKTSAF